MARYASPLSQIKPLQDAGFAFSWYGAYDIAKSGLLLLAGVFSIYHLGKLIYNLFFHPLRHIPGPWLSRGSYLPEIWYDVVRKGRYTKQIQKMHEKYGMLDMAAEVWVLRGSISHILHTNRPDCSHQPRRSPLQ
jgi:hypothetical protein